MLQQSLGGMDTLRHDLRYAIRSLRNSPSFTAVAVLTLALGIGANTAVFSVLNAMVLQTVAALDPSGLVIISVTDTLEHHPAYIYADTFTAFRAQQQSFSRLSLYSGGGVLRAESKGTSIDAVVEGIMPEYFELLGARPAAGRLLTDADQSIAGVPVPVVVVTDRLRRQVFGADRGGVGETLIVSGMPLGIVGVLQPGFVGLQADSGTDLYVPLSVLRSLSGDSRRPVRALNVIGRLAPGVALQQARAEVRARWPAIQAATVPPTLNETEQLTLRSQGVDVASAAMGVSVLRRQYGSALTVLLALTAVLLAIGCLNLAGLMVARAMRRQRAIAIHVALGATPGRLVHQSLIESGVLVTGGLVIAWPLAFWATHWFNSELSIGRIRPLLHPVTPDARVLWVSTLVSVITGLLTGVLPAWRAVHVPAPEALQSGRCVTSRVGRASRVLLVGQVALSMVLVVGAGLFVQSLRRLQANDQAFRHRTVLWTRIWRRPGDRSTLDRSYWQTLLQQLAAMRGVEAAAASNYFPAYLGFPGVLPTDTYRAATDASLTMAALTEVTSPGFFDMFGIGRLQGRDFNWTDDEHAPPVAILSETAARHLFPSGDRLSRRLRVAENGSSTDLEVVGIVADAPIGTLREPHQPVIFRPLLQQLARTLVPDVHVRVAGDLSTVRAEYIRVVESQGHHFVRGLFTLDGWLDAAVLQERLLAGIASYAALLAVLLGCVGIYGLLAYTVTSRVRELGLRIALGATRTGVVGMIVRDGSIIVTTGTALGIPCALLAGRVAGANLYGLRAADPTTLIGAAIVFLVTGVSAALVPAVRAASLDPITALRDE
jgi:predicted permease